MKIITDSKTHALYAANPFSRTNANTIRALGHDIVSSNSLTYDVLANVWI